jgi:hypothetical protein
VLTSAWDNALEKVDFRPLTGVPVYLDTTNVTAVDQGWVVSSLRQAMLAQGVLLRPKPEQAQWIVEARVGAYGTNEDSFLVGVPQTTVPPTVTGIPSGTIPEISFMKRSNQEGVAKLALFAYDRASGQFVWNSGTMMATANAKNVYLGGLGPIKSGSIMNGAEFAGIRLPLTSDPNATDPAQRSTKPLTSSDPAALRLPAATDLDSFMP